MRRSALSFLHILEVFDSLHDFSYLLHTNFFKNFFPVLKFPKQAGQKIANLLLHLPNTHSKCFFTRFNDSNNLNL